MTNKEKVINFLTDTTTNTSMSEAQYDLFDSATDGLSYYEEMHGSIDRHEYFAGEVGNGWDQERIDAFVEVFSL